MEGRGQEYFITNDCSGEFTQRSIQIQLTDVLIGLSLGQMKVKKKTYFLFMVYTTHSVLKFNSLALILYRLHFPLHSSLPSLDIQHHWSLAKSKVCLRINRHFVPNLTNIARI